MIGMGCVEDWTALTGLRVLLGVFEAGFFPGTWYVRYDTGKRYGVFYLIGSLASALSGILAYGLMQMNGLAGYAGWRWIFIMEGIITVLLGIGGYFLIVPFPDQDAWKSKFFLTKQEVEFVIATVEEDRGDSKPEPFNMVKFLRPARSPKVWGFAMMFLCTTTMAYAIAYFLPIILRDRMGFDIAASQCLVAPPYAFGALLMFAESWFGDKYHVRGPQILTNCVMGITGLAITGWTPTVGSQYFGIFLLTGAVQANIPQVMSYQANNIRGQWTRAFCSATLVGFGGIGGIAGTMIFRPQDAPAYIPGLWACITACLIIGTICISLDLYFMRQNKRAAAGEIALEGSDGSFRYTL
ncbi:hypothetical protein LTR37_001652 [Vermiconidia calcicola]|uniref:Uncharacterized protein n=1 Tax=Vermiconidia calcicola TaxID=1690605 RepID=A0ACC3NY66_9PEZI|nr:hypothetical protein LTR37_001652 [Vermiconidia calcicola]